MHLVKTNLHLAGEHSTFGMRIERILIRRSSRIDFCKELEGLFKRIKIGRMDDNAEHGGLDIHNDIFCGQSSQT